MGNVSNKYLGLRILIISRLLLGGKLSILKIWNAVVCYGSFFLRRKTSSKSPYLINFELWNECNESCVFCRSDNNEIYDSNPGGDGSVISKGKLKFETYLKVLDEFSSRLMLAIPYINGEPLMSKDIYKAIQAATDRKVGTMIASNGILLNESNSRKLLTAGLDCLKVHISGFTTPVHSIQHRRGDVEKIKKNLIRLVEIRKEVGSNAIILLDFIKYEHNKHELELARKFAQDLGILFNIRPGNPRGMESSEPLQSTAKLPTDVPCAWLWTVLTIDWNGAVYPCCEHVVWTDVPAYGWADKENLSQIWNGADAKAMRTTHLSQGRTPIPICAKCPLQGVKFKW
ncbi:MAG: radical SAM protein [Rhodospirillales bacterium]|jgi:radical SAM protein with 4Fe4S-binding SPASM domain|nr:radical SAM protein [Rhodospirillales bacterium]MBT3906931.1 radical SAM protein [Rhodospirillaceae bacterium]MBT5033320.1 radical SAM protein [Rhodospirillaceae bacterium]MBT6220920.1 radical SAM protein [Rhodospirillaceae bacterium]MBT6360759.1 radical SAM protein [Rhodospirillaceae bacterium]